MKTLLTFTVDGRIYPEKFFNKQNLYRFSLEFKLADLWIGLYYDKDSRMRDLDIWLCLIPCFPIHFSLIANEKRNSVPLSTP